MSIKKVFHISSLHSRYDSRIYRRECVYLAKHGYDVTLLVNDGHPDETRENVEIKSIANNKKTFYRKLIVPIIFFYQLMRMKSDIVHFHDPELIPLGLILSAFFGKSVIYDVHENYRSHSNNGLYNYWQTFLNIQAGKRLNLIFAESSYSKNYKSVLNSIEVLNYADLDFFKPYELSKINTSNIEIFYVGGVNKDRGLREVIDVLGDLENEFEFGCFHIIGPVRNQAELEYIKAGNYASISDKVIFHGKMELEQAYNVAQTCSLGIAITLDTENYRESLSTKVFEYLAVGLPVVFSNFKIYGTLVNENVGVAVYPDKNGIKNGIKKVLCPEVLTSAHKKCLILRHKYSVKSEMVKLINFYDRVFI